MRHKVYSRVQLFDLRAHRRRAITIDGRRIQIAQILFIWLHNISFIKLF